MNIGGLEIEKVDNDFVCLIMSDNAGDLSLSLDMTKSEIQNIAHYLLGLSESMKDLK